MSDSDSSEEYYRINDNKRKKKKKQYQDDDQDLPSDIEQYEVGGSDEEEEDELPSSEEDNSSEKEEPEEEEDEDAFKPFSLPKESEPAKIYVFCGTPASGKSYFVRSMFYEFAKKSYFKGGLCFSGTYNDDYGWLDPRCVRQTFDEDTLAKFVEHLRVKTKEGKEKNGHKWKPPHMFLIIDDQLGQVSESNYVANLWSCHRHIGLSIFVLTQYIGQRKNFSTLLRNMTNFAFVWPQTSKNSIKGLYEAFGGLFDNQKQYEAALNQCRKIPYSCLLFQNNPQLFKPEQAYQIVKAPGDIPEFKLLFKGDPKNQPKAEKKNDVDEAKNHVENTIKEWAGDDMKERDI
jgi:hypothetical protein